MAAAAAAVPSSSLHTAPQAELVEQTLEVTPQQRNDITELINRLNDIGTEVLQSLFKENGLDALKSSYSDLEEKVNKIHPLAFLCAILSDSALKRKFKNILNKIKIGETFSQNLYGRLTQYALLRDRKYLNFTPFFNALGVTEENKQKLEIPSRTRNWEKMMKILLKC